MLKNLFTAYFSRQTEALPPELARALAFHWRGQFEQAIEEYDKLLAAKTFAPGTPESDLALADRALLEVKQGKPFPATLDFDQIGSPSARLIAHYARFYWGFWTNHDVAFDSIRKMFFLTWRSDCPDFIYSVLFFFGHVWTIRTGNRLGYYLATFMHRRVFSRARKKTITDFSKNVVLAAYPYTQFISGRVHSDEIARTIEVAEKFVSKEDPYYQSLLLISGLYGYAYSGNIAKTEIFCQKFRTLHQQGKLLRYATISEVMRLLPFALRGYGHLVEKEYVELIAKFSKQESDVLIRSQFYRACAVISLILGNNARAQEYVKIARQERLKTNSFKAWEKFDKNIEVFSARKIPFKLGRDRLLNINSNDQPPPQLGPILFKLIDLLPKAVEHGRDWLEDEIKNIICQHIGANEVKTSRDLASVSVSHHPSILIGSLYIEFTGIPESQTGYIREILNSLAAAVNPYLRNYQKLVEAQKIERDAAIVGLASETAHNILASLDALDFDLSDSLQDQEEQRIRRRNVVYRMKSVANGLLQRKKHLLEATRTNVEAPRTVELISGLIDNVVIEKRVKYAHIREVEIVWNLSPLSYSAYFARVDAPQFEVTIGNIIDNAVEAVLARSSGKVSLNIERVKNAVNIVIHDTGCGIPAHILEKVGTPNFSHGKANGNGYGLFHANKTIRDLGGALTIDSREGIGTTVTASIPVVSAPDWFVPSLDLAKVKDVFILDDDSGAHTIWDARLSDRNELKIHHFYSTSEVEAFLNANTPDFDQSLFLFDFELTTPNGAGTSGGPRETGLSLIQRFAIRNAYIVSSYYREQSVLAKCLESGVRIIPKNFIRFVPLQYASDNGTSVLIDDDSIVHQTWTMQANRAGKPLFTYYTVEEFIADAQKFGRQTKIYVDSNLGNGRKGEVESKKISALGFVEIHLTTALPVQGAEKMAHIKSVISKAPPL